MCVYYALPHLIFLQPPFESTRVKKRLAWHVTIAALGLPWKNKYSSPTSQLTAYWASWFHAANLPFQTHVYHCKTTKSQETLLLVSLFLLSSFYQRTVGTQRGTDRTIYSLCCGGVYRKRTSLCPGEGIQWCGITKTVSGFSHQI